MAFFSEKKYPEWYPAQPIFDLSNPNVARVSRRKRSTKKEVRERALNNEVEVTTDGKVKGTNTCIYIPFDELSKLEELCKEHHFTSISDLIRTLIANAK